MPLHPDHSCRLGVLRLCDQRRGLRRPPRPRPPEQHQERQLRLPPVLRDAPAEAFIICSSSHARQRQQRRRRREPNASAVPRLPPSLLQDAQRPRQPPPPHQQVPQQLIAPLLPRKNPPAAATPPSPPLPAPAPPPHAAASSCPTEQPTVLLNTDNRGCRRWRPMNSAQTRTGSDPSQREELIRLQAVYMPQRLQTLPSPPPSLPVRPSRAPAAAAASDAAKGPDFQRDGLDLLVCVRLQPYSLEYSAA